MKVSTIGRVVAMFAAVGVVTIIALVINAICVSIFGYSDLIGLATKWYVAMAAVAIMALVMLATDKCMCAGITKEAEEHYPEEEEF